MTIPPALFPPFRAEHVGSLLRPADLLDLRRRFARGEIDQATLIAAEDRAIEDAVALQARVGLRLATDGEFRRQSYHGYFYGQLGDISFDAPADGTSGGRAAQPMAVDPQPHRLEGRRSTRRISRSCVRAPRRCRRSRFPGPCALHFRGGDAAVTAQAYRDVDQFWDDIVAAFRSELRALARPDARYVQIDETAFAKFGDPEVRATLRRAATSRTR